MREKKTTTRLKPNIETAIMFNGLVSVNPMLSSQMSPLTTHQTRSGNHGLIQTFEVQLTHGVGGMQTMNYLEKANAMRLILVQESGRNVDMSIFNHLRETVKNGFQFVFDFFNGWLNDPRTGPCMVIIWGYLHAIIAFAWWSNRGIHRRFARVHGRKFRHEFVVRVVLVWRLVVHGKPNCANKLRKTSGPWWNLQEGRVGFDQK